MVDAFRRSVVGSRSSVKGLRAPVHAPRSSVYEVNRSVNGGAMEFVGATGVKTFTDDSPPVGASPCTYQVTAVRSTARGNPAPFTVHFGVGGPGLTIASTTSDDGADVKMAAW